MKKQELSAENMDRARTNAAILAQDDAFGRNGKGALCLEGRSSAGIVSKVCEAVFYRSNVSLTKQDRERIVRVYGEVWTECKFKLGRKFHEETAKAAELRAKAEAERAKGYDGSTYDMLAEMHHKAANECLARLNYEGQYRAGIISREEYEVRFQASLA